MAGHDPTGMNLNSYEVFVVIQSRLADYAEQVVELKANNTIDYCVHSYFNLCQSRDRSRD